MATNNKEFTAKNGIISKGKIVGSAATTSLATLNLPHGTAPTSPTNGDVWTDTSGLYVQISGSTVGPLGAPTPIRYPTFYDSLTVEDDPLGDRRTIIFGDGPYSYMAGTNSYAAGSFNTYRSRGTLASPASVADGDVLGYPYYGMAYDGSDYYQIGQINFTVAGTPSTGVIPTRLGIGVMDNAGLFWEPLVVMPNRDTLLGGSLSTGVGVSTGDAKIELGGSRTDTGNSYIDFHSTPGTDYEARIIRNSGTNGVLGINNTGTGSIAINSLGNAAIDFYTNNIARASIGSDGNFTVSNSSSGIPSLIVSSQNASGFYPAFMRFERTGTAGAATPNNSAIGEFRWDGRDSTGAYRAFAAIGVSIGTNASGGAPTTIIFSNGASGTDPTDVFKLNPDKSAQFYGTAKMLTGTTSFEPINIPAGSLLTSPVAGAIERTSDAMYITHNATTGRGINIAPQMLVAQSNSSAATTTTAVSPFGTSNDTLTLEAGKLYRFRGEYYVTSTFSSGTANIRLGFTFSNAPTSFKYTFTTYNQTAGTVILRLGTVTSASSTQVTPNITSTISYVIRFEGWFTSNATTGGTILPYFDMSTTGSSTVATQYSSFEIQKMGASGAVVIAGSWA